MSPINASPAQASNWKQLSCLRVFVGNDASYKSNRYPLLNNRQPAAAGHYAPGGEGCQRQSCSNPAK